MPVGEDLPPRAFVLVPGAWHGGWCWRRVRDRLERLGHRTYAPSLTGVADRSHLGPAGVGLRTHIADVINLVRWEGLSEVVLCGHSYGGCVISGVLEALEKQIGALVFLDAFVPDDGQSVLEMTAPAAAASLRSRAERGELVVPPVAAERFNVNPADREWVDQMCTPHPLACFLEPIALSGARERIGSKTFIRASGYRSPALDARLAGLRGVPGWHAEVVGCGHDAMIDEPELIAALLLQAAARDS